MTTNQRLEEAMTTRDPWIICPACRGDGTHVNPDIDSHGLTASDMESDPDFYENYRSGFYDVPCKVCDRTGKIRESQLKDLEAAAEARQEMAYEMGIYDGSVTDFRYGYS